MRFGKLATVDIAGVPAWALVVGVLAVALAILWYRERSARGVQRSAERSAKRAVGVVGVGVGGVLYGVLGASRGAASILDVFGAFILEIPDVLAYAGTSTLGYFALKGDVALSAAWFAVIAGVLFLLGVALDE